MSRIAPEIMPTATRRVARTIRTKKEGGNKEGVLGAQATSNNRIKSDATF